jgi:hypothetical protein
MNAVPVISTETHKLSHPSDRQEPIRAGGALMSAHFLSLAEYRLLSMRSQLYAQGGLCPELFSSLRSYGLDHEMVLAHAGIYTVTTASFSGSNTGDAMFDFDPDGVPTAVIGALQYDHAHEQYVADLVAWPLHDPVNFATALGPHDGAHVLGVEHMVQRGGLPLRVFRTPLEWLQAGCVGCVPLTEKGGRYWLDKAGGPFVVGSLEEGRKLRDYLGAAVTRHQILLPADERRTA